MYHRIVRLPVARQDRPITWQVDKTKLFQVRFIGGFLLLLGLMVSPRLSTAPMSHGHGLCGCCRARWDSLPHHCSVSTSSHLHLNSPDGLQVLII